LSAARQTLSGFDAAGGAAPVSGSASLHIDADTLQLGPGSMTVSGFAQSVFSAADRVVGQGTGTLQLSGSLDVVTPLITVARGANTHVEATQGTARIQGGAPDADVQNLELGGTFSLWANRIEDATRIVAPSGLVTLRSKEEMVLGANSAIDVAGRLVAAGGREVGSQGGTIRLDAAGDLLAAAETRVDLSGAGDSSAGRLYADAAGTVDFSAAMVARAA